MGYGLVWCSMARKVTSEPSSEPERILRDALLKASPPACEFDFHRPTHNGYNLDFAWEVKGLVVEVDGPQHRSSASRKRDGFRTHRLHQEGWKKVLRFSTDAVTNDTSQVVSEIEIALR